MASKVAQVCVSTRHSEVVYVSPLFKINGEYIDFDLMNLELNTADDRIERNMR